MGEQDVMSPRRCGNERLGQGRYAIAEHDGSRLMIIEDKGE